MAQVAQEHVEEWTLLEGGKQLIGARSESDLSSSDEAPPAGLGVSVYFSNVEENLELLKGEQLDPKNPKFLPVAENTAKMSGTMYLTNYQLIYKTRSLEDGTQEDLKIPIGLIDRVEFNLDGSVQLLTKHLMAMNLSFASSEMANAFIRRLNDLMILPPHQRFAFYNLEDVSSLSQKDGWDVYDIRHEYFDRQGVDTSKWRVTEVNKEFLICKSYPQLFAVPAAPQITDEVLTRAAKFRASGRLPALCWYNPRTRASICRSSQPLVGLVGNRNQDDEELIRAIAATNPHRNPIYIVDCRPWSSALANRAKGAGVESVENYSHSRLMFMNVDNIHTMRDSLKTVFDLLRTGKGDNRWLSSLDSTRWLEHLRLVLTGGARIARMLEMERCSVLVHCSDGWDRTAQLSCLAQLLLDPYYRTLRGFQVLLEKEWLSFGHKFADRCGHGKGMFQDSECSPVFLQFIDCVWQISNQFQCAFQFNEHFLIFLLDNLYSCRFGTFLCNTELERIRHKVRSKSVSLWSYVNAKAPQFINPIYKAHEGALFPVCTPQYISFWGSYYLRFHHKTPQIREDEHDRETLRTQLASRNVKLEAEVHKLKKLLAKEAQRMRELEVELERATREKKDMLKKAVNCTIYKGGDPLDSDSSGLSAEPQVLAKIRSAVSDAELLQQFTTDLKNLQVIEDYNPNCSASESSSSKPVRTSEDDEFIVVGEPSAIAASPPSNSSLALPSSSNNCGMEDQVMLEISESAADGVESNTVRFPVRLNDYLRTLTHYVRQYGNGFLPSFLVQPTASS